MNSEQEVANPQVCVKHNKSFLLFDDQNQGIQCILCVQELTGMISIESYEQKLKVIINQESEKCNKYIQLLKILHNSILNYKASFLTSLDSIIQVIESQLKFNENFSQNIYQLNLSGIDHHMSLHDVQVQCHNLQEQNNKVSSQIQQTLQNFQKKDLYDVDELLTLLNQKLQLFEKETLIDQNIGQKKFQYQLIRESCEEENRECFAFAFNKENNVLIAGYYGLIIIYKFINSTFLKEVQRLTDHTNFTSTFYFMKQTNQFISGGFDKQIIIWEFDKNKNIWIVKNLLKDHKESVYCILMNKKENLMISGSKDKTIKFWIQNNNSWHCNQTVDTRNWVQAMSMNDKENKLITWGECSPISVIEMRSDKQWRVIQTIDVSTQGFRLCFTIGDQFIYQNLYFNQMDVYQYDKDKGQFYVFQSIKMQQSKDSILLFPCQYIDQLRIATIKHGKYLNIFKINQDGSYYLIQTLEFDTDRMQGRFSDDGQYLVTWDQAQYQIQMRKLKYLE